MPHIAWDKLLIEEDYTANGETHRWYETTGPCIVEGGRRSYCDDEIAGQVTIAELFRYAERAECLLVAAWPGDLKSYHGSDEGEKRVWLGEDGSRIEYWSYEGDYYIAMQLGTELCWVVSCIHCHPAVETNDWSFANSDGSTHSVCEELDLSNLIQFLLQQSLTYLFEQKH